MQVEQTNITVASRYSPFLYIDNTTQNKTKREIVVLEKKKNPSTYNGEMPWISMKCFFSSIRMSPKTWLNHNTIAKPNGTFNTLFWLVKN